MVKKSRSLTLQELQMSGFSETSPGVFERVKKSNDPQQVSAKEGKKLLEQKERPEGLLAIERVLRVANIPFINEHKFSKKRRFRFDIAIPKLMLAIEYEGIFSEKSRHTNVKGYTEDATKYNLAQSEGWTVKRYTAMNYKNFLEDLKTILSKKNV